jgi:multidrug efflux pump
MICSKLLRRTPSHNRLYRLSERGLNVITEGYRRSLSAILQVRWLVILLAVITAGTSYFLFTGLKAELARS